MKTNLRHPVAKWLFEAPLTPAWRKRLELTLGVVATGAAVALLFAAEHGPYWDVGLAAGIIYNYWMVRTRSLGDLIWAHAITNAALCAYVLYTHKWEFWL